MGDAGSRGLPGAGWHAGRGILGEVLLLWLITLLLIRAVVVLVQSAGLPDFVLAAVPILFMYAPVLLCRWRGVDSYDYPLALPSFRDRRPWGDAIRLNAVVIGAILVPWLVGYHLWQTGVMGFEWKGTWPSEPHMLVLYHLFFVAIPEEFFYRGYIQTRLDELWKPRWRVLGATVGPSLLVTSFIFAFGHSLVFFQWWHFAIFFPSLVFGWMRARTGDIVAGAVFHAWANVTVATLDALYGVVPP